MRIALIHAVTIAMQPIEKAFAELWPEAELVNLLDDSLSIDRAKERELSTHMGSRIQFLTDYALDVGAKGILFTCSAFGSAIENAAKNAAVPVLKPNEAMFRQAIESGGQVGMLASFAPALSGMEKEFYTMAAENQSNAKLLCHCVPEAKQALDAGDEEAHNRLMADGVKALNEADVIMLAHFSSARAYEAVKERTDKPVLTSPSSAVALLQKKLKK